MTTDTPLTDHEAGLTATGLYVTAEYARGLEQHIAELHSKDRIKTAEINNTRTINCMESMKQWAIKRGLKVR